MVSDGAPSSLWRKHGVVLCLAALLLFHALFNALWLRQDWTMRGWDMGPHMVGVVNAHNLVREQGLAGAARVARGQGPYQWPSAAYLPWLLPTPLLGLGADNISLTSSGFLWLLLLLVFALGRRLCSWQSGLLAAALVGCYPLIYGEGRIIGFDLPNGVMVTLCLLLLLRTERLGRPGRGLLLGVGLGVATLIKPNVHFTLAIPVALYFVVALVRPPEQGRRRVVASTLLAAAAAALVSSVWWGGRLGAIAHTFVAHQQGTVRMPFHASSPLAFYLEALLKVMGPALLVALALGSVALLVDCWRRRREPPAKKSPRELWLLAAWIGGGAAVLSLISVHQQRYMLPLLPALALATAAGIRRLPAGAPRLAATALVLAAGAVTWGLGSVNAQLLPGSSPGPGQLMLGVKDSWAPPQTSRLVWVLTRAAETLQRRHPTGEGVLVRAVFDVDYDLPMRWSTPSILASVMPRVRLTRNLLGAEATNPIGDPVLNSSVPFITSRYSVRHCYSLRAYIAATPHAPRAEGCVRVFDQQVVPPKTSDFPPMRISVYHYPGCSLFLCRAEGFDPRSPEWINRPR